MRIHYRQGEHGWGKVRFEIGGIEFERDVSYLSEPLVELANLARHVLDPSFRFNENHVRFLDEPGAIALHVRQADASDPAGIRMPSKIYNSGIITFNDAEPEHMLLDVIAEELQDGMSIEPEVGAIVAEERLTSVAIAQAIFLCLDEVSERETPWSFLKKNIAAPFPLTEFAILGAMLGEEPRWRRLW